MGTRSTITFYEKRDDKHIPYVSIYQCFDGYLEGVGKDLCMWLKNKIIVNGISLNDKRDIANGIGCLIAKYIRDNNKLKSSEQLTDDTYNTYYFEHFKKLNTMDAIYDSYALAIPGDIIAKRGHVRMESGYPYVVCKDGTHKTQKYSRKFLY